MKRSNDRTCLDCECLDSNAHSVMLCRVHTAAPDLLAALEAIMRLVPHDIAETVAGHKARAAIAKATAP